MAAASAKLAPFLGQPSSMRIEKTATAITKPKVIKIARLSGA
jgi:hypothetical protein